MDDKINIQKLKIKNLLPDDNNANVGTERGKQVLEQSLEEFGFAEAGTLDKNYKIIGGNKRHEIFNNINPNEDVIVVDVDGSKPVYIRRPDLDLDENKARKLAYALNRSHELSYQIDIEKVMSDIDTDLDLSNLWFDYEIWDEEAKAITEIESETNNSESNTFNIKKDEKSKQIRPVLYLDDIEIFEQAIQKTGLKNRAEAIVKICREYVETKGQYNI